MSNFQTTVVFNRYVEIAEIHTQLIRIGMNQIMIQAVQEAKSLVPQKDRIDTGRKTDLATSTLQKSIMFRRIEQEIYELYTNSDHAIYNEFGTTRMSAVPFMFPAVLGAWTKVDTLLSAVLAQGF